MSPEQTNSIEKLSLDNSLELNLRQAELTEAHEIGELLRKCAAQMADQGLTHWTGYHTDERCLGDIKSATVIGAWTNENRLVSTFTLSPHVPDYAGTGFDALWADFAAEFRFLKKLAVDPDFQRSGIGRAMTQQAERLTSLAEIQYLRLDINPMVRSLGDFYESLGFKYRGEANAGIVYEKDLAI